jgi:hypothetical protein
VRQSPTHKVYGCCCRHFDPSPGEIFFYFLPSDSGGTPSKVMSFLIESDFFDFFFFFSFGRGRENVRRMCRVSCSAPASILHRDIYTHTHTRHFLIHETKKKKKEEDDDKMGDEMSFDSGMLKRFRDCVRHDRRQKLQNNLQER